MQHWGPLTPEPFTLLAPDSKCAVSQAEGGWVSSFLMYKNKTKIKDFNILYFLQELTVLKLTRVKCFTEFLRQKENIGEKNLAVEYRVCVCVCVCACVCVCLHKAVFDSRKI